MIYIIIFAHWFADFILQTDKMAINKSTSWKWLSSHVLTYTITMLPLGPVFALTNGATHFLVDAVTSRMTSYLWKKQDRHNFFVVIGLDQAIHLAILVATMPLLGWSWYL